MKKIIQKEESVTVCDNCGKPALKPFPESGHTAPLGGSYLRLYAQQTYFLADTSCTRPADICEKCLLAGLKDLISIIMGANKKS